MATASKVLSIAEKEIGYSRWDDPNPGTKYGRWYAQDHGSYFGQSGVPYCAMFAAWVLAQAGQTCPGMPTAAVLTAYNGAKSAGIVRADKKAAKPGDLVVFNWNDGGKAQDHIGFVELNKGSYIQTIEGNTSSGASGSQGNGGGVYRRTRAWSNVYAVIAVPYDGTSVGTTGGTTTAATGKIAVDGCIGTASTKAWQTQLGTTSDGIISGQDADDQPAIPNVYSERIGKGGSAMVKALQTFLNRFGFNLTVDGYLGKKTVTALQQWMRDKLGYKKHAIDGILGYNTACNVQNAINAGAFK